MRVDYNDRQISRSYTIIWTLGNDLLQQSTDALALFANAKSELNQRRRELIKPYLYDEYKHLCSSSLAITDQLFGDDLPKQVKELTEVNRVAGKRKESTHSGRSTAKPDYHRHNYYARGRGRPGHPYYRKPFFRLVEKRPLNVLTPLSRRRRGSQSDSDF